MGILMGVLFFCCIIVLLLVCVLFVLGKAKPQYAMRASMLAAFAAIVLVVVLSIARLSQMKEPAPTHPSAEEQISSSQSVPSDLEELSSDEASLEEASSEDEEASGVDSSEEE